MARNLHLEASGDWVDGFWAASAYEGWSPEATYAATAGWDDKRLVKVIICYIQLNGSFKNAKKLERRSDPNTVKVALEGVKASAGSEARKADITLPRVAACYPDVLLMIRKKFLTQIKKFEGLTMAPEFQDVICAKMAFVCGLITEEELKALIRAQGALFKQNTETIEKSISIVMNTLTFPIEVRTRFLEVHNGTAVPAPAPSTPARSPLTPAPWVSSASTPASATTGTMEVPVKKSSPAGESFSVPMSEDEDPDDDKPESIVQKVSGKTHVQSLTKYMRKAGFECEPTLESVVNTMARSSWTLATHKKYAEKLNQYYRLTVQKLKGTEKTKLEGAWNSFIST